MAPLPYETASPAEPRRSFISRNLGLIVSISLLVAFWMLLYTFTMYQPNFKAQATVIIKDSAITNRYVEPEQFYAMQTTTSTSSNPVLNTMGILKSQPISVALWNYFSAQHPEELKALKIKTQKEWDAYYQDGSGFIKAKNQQGTDLISIQFGWRKPQIAKEALTVIVKAFQESSRDLNKEEQINRNRFLSTQMNVVQAQLEAIRTEKSQYQTQAATVSIRREGDDLAGSRMELENKLAQLQAQAQGKENLVRRYQHMLKMTPEAAIRAAALGQDSSMVNQQNELYRLQQQHSMLSSSLTDNNPKVRELQAQIQQVRNNIEMEKSRVMGPFGQGNGNDDVVADATRNTLINDMLKAQADSQDLHAQLAVLRIRLGQINANIRQFPGTAEGLSNLEQQEASLSSALDHLRQRVMEGKMKEAQTLSNVFVVDAPRLPDHPSFPNQNHLVVLSIVLGLAAGLAVAFIKDQLFTAQNHTALPGRAYENEFGYDNEEFTSAEIVSEASADNPQTGNGAWRPNAASNLVVPTAASLRKPQPANELPITGSLFDTLAPVSGWEQRKAKPQQAIRRDLTGPLPTSTPEPATAESVSEIAAQSENPVVTPSLQDEALLPPPMQATRPVAAAPVQQAQSAQTFTPALGVPVLHAAPSAAPGHAKEVLSVDVLPPVSATKAQPEAAPIQRSVVEEDSATALYEAQAKAMPLPRKRGRVPAFLLNDNSLDVDSSYDAPQAPYELVPRKQRLQANDDLHQDMSPLPSTPTAPDYPPMPQFVPPEFLHKRKKSTFGSLFSGKKHREPELVLGGLPPRQR